MKISVKFWILLCLAVLPLAAQNGLIQGAITDPSGAMVVGAKIAAFDEGKGIVVRETVTSDDGTFQLRPLLQGVYTIRIESPGFKRVERRGLNLDTGQVMNLGNLALEISTTDTAIVVQAEIPMVETTTAQKSYVVTGEQVTELSLNGRDFGSLMATLPGVTNSSASDFRLAFSDTSSFNVNGGRGSMNSMMLDGTVNTDAGDNGSQYTQPSLDAIAEFKVVGSGFQAEYGRISGAAIMATTKSGGEQFHGTLYYFGRNNALDARPPFDMTGKTSKLQFHQFGGNIGGPIYLGRLSSRTEKRLFFFFNHETTRGEKPNGGQYVDIPRPELLDGNFSLASAKGLAGTVFEPGTIQRDQKGNITGGTPFPGNIVPKSMWSRNANAFLKILNMADRSVYTATPGNNPELMRIPLADTYQLRKNQDILRADYHLNDRTNLFFRVSHDQQHEETGLGIWSSTPYPVLPTMHEKPGTNWTANFVKIFSPTKINETIVTYEHQYQILGVAPGVDSSSYDRDTLGFSYGQLFADSNLINRFPRFNCAVGSCNFGGTPFPWENEGRDYAITDNLTLMHGSHTFKVGAYLNLDDKQQQPTWNDAGSFDFSSSNVNINPFDTNNGLANLLTGYYSTASQTNGRLYGSFRFLGTEFYGQDTWAVSRHLTLDLGARYAYLGPTYSRGDILANYWDPTRYDPSKAVSIVTATGFTKGSILPGSGDPFNGIVQENTPGVPSGFGQHHKNQVSPRIGFAYAPGKDGKTSIRGSFGTFFERMRQNANNFSGLANPPASYTPSVYAGQIDNMSSALLANGTRFPVNLIAFNRNFNTPTIYSWNFGVQRQLARNVSLDVSYIGNVARHLQYVMDLNQLPLGTTTSTNILKNANSVNDAIRPYKGFGSINYTDYGANSSYNALQVRVMRRFSKRLTMNANYTWSKALDIVDVDNTAIDYYANRQRQWGPAGFDRNHVLGVDYVFYVPDLARGSMNHRFFRGLMNGWQLSGVMRVWSGLPLTITSNGNAGTLGNNYRADYLGGDVYPETKTRNEYFDPLAFARPADGTLGNTGKGILRGPGLWNFDTSLFKNFKLAEKRSLQFRLETFNTLNHTEWFGVNTGISSPSAGPITTATRGTTGQVTTTRDPRNIQLSMKFYF